MGNTFWTVERTWRRFGRRWPHGRLVRLLLGMLALGHGVLRVDPFDWFTHPGVIFGSDMLFGVALVICGLAVLLTLRERLDASGRLAAVSLAVLYAVLGAALYPASAGGAYTDAIIVITMLNEASAYE